MCRTQEVFCWINLFLLNLTSSNIINGNPKTKSRLHDTQNFNNFHNLLLFLLCSVMKHIVSCWIIICFNDIRHVLMFAVIFRGAIRFIKRVLTKKDHKASPTNNYSTFGESNNNTTTTKNVSYSFSKVKFPTLKKKTYLDQETNLNCSRSSSTC